MYYNADTANSDVLISANVDSHLHTCRETEVEAYKFDAKRSIIINLSPRDAIREQ